MKLFLFFGLTLCSTALSAPAPPDWGSDPGRRKPNMKEICEKFLAPASLLGLKFPFLKPAFPRGAFPRSAFLYQGAARQTRIAWSILTH